MPSRFPFILVAAFALALPFQIDDVFAHDLSRGSEPPSVLWNQTGPLSLPDPCLAASGSVESRGVAIGPDQDPVAVGVVADLVVVVKYDRRSGERLWCHSFRVMAAATKRTTFPVPFARVRGVAIDRSGTIFIGGDGRIAPPPPPPARPGLAPEAPVNRYFVTKCSSGGACASTVTFVSPTVGGSHHDTIGGIAVGPDGDPVLTGLAAFPSSGRTTFKLLTVKVDGSRLSLLGEALAPSNAPTIASSEGVAVDSSNDIFVTGTEASTLKYDSRLSGKPSWTKRLAGARVATMSDRDGEDDWLRDGRERGGRNDDDRGRADHSDHGATRHHGDKGEADEVAVIRTALHAGTATQDFEVTRLDGETGVALWTKTYDSGFNDIPRDVAMDRSGNILVAGDVGRKGGQPASLFQDGLLVSFSQTGTLSWVAGFPARRSTGDSLNHSFFSVAVGSDSDPVVSGYSDVGPPFSRRLMDTIKYTFQEMESDHESSHGDDHQDYGLLAWDEPINDEVTGFRICIDAQPMAACQDVGKPTGYILPKTTARSLSYTVALQLLTSLTAGTHTLSAIAYNANGDSVPSEPLSIRRPGTNDWADGWPAGWADAWADAWADWWEKEKGRRLR